MRYYSKYYRWAADAQAEWEALRDWLFREDCDWTLTMSANVNAPSRLRLRLPCPLPPSFTGFVEEDCGE